MTDHIEDRRRPPFYWIDKTVFEKYAAQIGVYGIAVYNALAYHADPGGASFPAAPTIAVEIGCSERKVRSVLQELESAGLVTVERDRMTPNGKQTSNRYTLHHMQGYPAPHADEQESVEQKENNGAYAPERLPW